MSIRTTHSATARLNLNNNKKLHSNLSSRLFSVGTERKQKNRKIYLYQNTNYSSLLGGRYPQVLGCHYDEPIYGAVGEEKK